MNRIVLLIIIILKLDVICLIMYLIFLYGKKLINKYNISKVMEYITRFLKSLNLETILGPFISMIVKFLGEYKETNFTRFYYVGLVTNSNIQNKIIWCNSPDKIGSEKDKIGSGADKIGSDFTDFKPRH